ncbi:MAG: BatA domain-containing protein [Pirellula sp.]
MQFVFPALAWGFLLVLLPLLIHLINLVRHRRTRWAAMEFLLESYRKHRRWVWLKQALLIASRMLAVAIAVAMLAQWVSGSRWLSLISQTTTHHYALIDDSASMGDTSSSGTAYQSALKAILAIASNAQSQDGMDLLTVVRASRSSLATVSAKMAQSNTPQTSSNPSASTTIQPDTVADIMARTIPTNPSSLLSKVNSTIPTPLECNFSDAIELISPLLRQATAEKSIVYLFSDFRSKDWSNAPLLRQQLLNVPGADVDLQLIDCVPDQHENLTMVSIAPQQEVLAAGVPAMINIGIRNNGQTPVRNVTVRVTAIEYGDREPEQKPTLPHSGLATELPPVILDRLEPGELVTRHVQVLFPRSGSHVVEAQLPPDSLMADNAVRCVLDLQEGIRVLLVDGDATGKHSFYFESALNPGGNAKTGLLMSRESPEFLRDTDLVALQNYACIILQSVPALDPRAIENLHGYVTRGGGLAVFFGEQMNSIDFQRYNSTWTKPIVGSGNSTPLMPFAIRGSAELKQSADGSLPDLIAENHPIFAPFFGLSNSPFEFVRIPQYVALENDVPATPTTPNSNSVPWKVVASLRNGQPLLIDHAIGDGRVLYGLTAFDRRWTNWPQDPTFVVAALKMVGYLSSFRTPETSRLAGTPLRWNFSSQELLPETQVLCPSAVGSNTKSILSVNASVAGESSLQASLDASANQTSDETVRAILASGNFEWWATTTQGDRVVKNFARNTPPIEGELSKISPPDLSRSLSGVKYAYKSADSLGSSSALAGFSNRNMLLLMMLLGLLLFEQWLAWSASYHLPRRT